MHKLMTRRATLGSMMACACCFSGLGALKAAEKTGASHGVGQTPHWAYEGSDGPNHWGELSPSFKTCQIGMEQTPIDLNGGVPAKFDQPFSLAYEAVGGNTVNNGHTIQVNLDKGCSCAIEGVTYDLLQFHFHHPSEHLISGKSFEMELHLVHKAETGALAVIGLFLRRGAENQLLAPVFDHMPMASGGEKALPAPLNPAGFFPTRSGYYRYRGSLTTPPCSEGLTWTVLREPVEASPAQISKFAALFPNNARPVQKLNNRILLEGGS